MRKLPLYTRSSWIVFLIVGLVSAAIYLGCVISPPALMDDVDAVQAQIARSMLSSGDWVSARLDGVLYLEKSPLLYWLIAICYQVFGVFDWAARIPIALSSIALALVTAAFGIWAFGRRAGLYAGLCIATCIGLFLFTRILIPDVTLTFTVALAMWAFLRALDREERHPQAWALLFAANLGVGLLLKSLIAVLFPVATGILYLFFTKEFFLGDTWRRLRPISGLLLVLVIAAPWHILATVRNPPYFSFTMHSVPGEYHGFLWFYFINEQLLRFLNLRYPHDYNTVPRLYFWLFHLLWLFPWSVYIPGLLRLSYRGTDRASRARLLTLCWTGFVLVFFTFSTTQEYYSMPCYPALALLIGCAIDRGGKPFAWGTRTLAAITGLASAAAFVILFLVRHVPAPGDISGALSAHPEAYTLSLGHMEDLTLESFAYLRLPLAVAAVAFAIGCMGTVRSTLKRTIATVSLMMVIFFHAARLALVVFDPYMSSRVLANTLLRSPKGELIIDHHYYTFSSVFFYTNRTAYLLNGRFNNLVYGSYAPGAPPVFVDDAEFQRKWLNAGRSYLIAELPGVQRLKSIVPPSDLNVVASSGGKYLLTNHPLNGS